MSKEKTIVRRKMPAMVIGLGNVGLKYDLNSSKTILSHANSIFKSKYFFLQCGVDKNLYNRNLFKKEYKTQAYSNVDLALKKNDPELIVVSSSTNTHLEIIKKIVTKKSLKYILLEKPGGNNEKDLKKIIHLCKINDVIVMINYFRLYNKKYKFLEKALKKIKKFKIIFHYNRGIYNNCSHLISLLNKYCYLPKKINILNYSKDSKQDPNPDFQITYKNGKAIFINSELKNLSFLQFNMLSLKELITSTDNFNNFQIRKIKKDKQIKKHSYYDENFFYINTNSQFSQKIVLDNFLKQCKNNKNIFTLHGIFLRTMKVLDRIRYLNNDKK